MPGRLTDATPTSLSGLGSTPSRTHRPIEKTVQIKNTSGVIDLEELNKLLAKGYRISYMLTPEVALLIKAG